MKNKVLLISAAFLLFIFLVYGTYFWYLFFLKASGNFEINKNNSLKSGDIYLKDDGNGVYDTDADIIESDEVDSVIPYKFIIKNEGNKQGNYDLYIEDLPINAVNDGCTTETLLDRSQLKYQLKEDGKVVGDDYLSNVSDNILYSSDIKANNEKKYELRIYIHDEATNFEKKHYHYKIVLSKEK